MDLDLVIVVRAAPGRQIGLAADGDLRLVWDNVAIRLPVYDLPHLAVLLDTWFVEEELPLLRRGYYRLMPGLEGGVQLWIQNTGLLLSREDLRTLATLITAAADELCRPLCRRHNKPHGAGYRQLVASRRGVNRHN
jgi:hypothetical protein